jgi:hypothetical protein
VRAKNKIGCADALCHVNISSALSQSRRNINVTPGLQSIIGGVRTTRMIMR